MLLSFIYFIFKKSNPFLVYIIVDEFAACDTYR